MRKDTFQCAVLHRHQQVRLVAIAVQTTLYTHFQLQSKSVVCYNLVSVRVC
jgi:hypothetical protein